MGDVWKRYRRSGPAVVGLAILVFLVLIGILAPYLSHFPPDTQHISQAFIHPNRVHYFGTDYLGRDILTRILFGARYSLSVGVLAVIVGIVVGVPLGLVSGYFGGWVDLVIQRVTDVLLSFPSILLALALVAILGVGLQNVIISVGISTIPLFIRVARGSVLQVRNLTYVQASQAVGAGSVRILGGHVLPNVMAPIVVQATLSIGFTILAAAGLGFLGLGVQPPTPEWGSMLGESRTYIFSAAYSMTFPGIFIFLAVLAFNLVGDGLRDALDPFQAD